MTQQRKGRQRRVRALTALVAVAALTMAGCAEDTGGNASEGGAEEGGPIKIGVILDITGAGASLGVPERKTIEMLAKQVNDAGGIDDREIKLFIEDNQSTEDAAAKAMNKLVTQEKVDIVLGASRTGPSLAMRPIAESNKIPMISLAANEKIVSGSEWVFKTAQNDKVVLENIIDYADKNGWKTIGLARDASGFGEGVAETLDELGASKGIKVVKVEKFAPDATDFTAQMVNLRDAKADMNLIWGIPPACALAQKAYKQLGITAPVMQSHGIGNQVFLDTAGDSADGLVAPLGRLLVADQLGADDPQREVIQKFVTDYQEFTGGESPSTFAGHAYDGFQLAIKAFEAVGTDKQKVRDYLEQVDDYVGITGAFRMTADDHSGLDKHALAFVTIENSDWKLLDSNRG